MLEGESRAKIDLIVIGEPRDSARIPGFYEFVYTPINKFHFHDVLASELDPLPATTSSALVGPPTPPLPIFAESPGVILHI